MRAEQLPVMTAWVFHELVSIAGCMALIEVGCDDNMVGV